jgi:hypothetical protein
MAWTFVKEGGLRAGEPPMCIRMDSRESLSDNACCVSGWKFPDDQQFDDGKD